MLKKLLIVLLLTTSLTACKKNNNNNGCGTQTCTASFASLGVAFTDNQGNPTIVQEHTLKNLRTGQPVSRMSYGANVDFVAGFVLVATDEIKSELSTEGDDIEITATSKTTGQVKKAIVKVSGGCNCHIAKVSGPETVKFD
jgi:hypothetical protein